MDTQPYLSLRDVVAHVVGDMVEALCDRPGESPQQRIARIEATTHTIMAFQPGDALEAMLAGRCVMFHEMIVDGVHDTLNGESARAQRATRSGIVAMDRAFGNNLTLLERYQSKPAEASPDAQPAGMESDIADRVRRHQSQSPVQWPRASAQGPSVGTMDAPDGADAVRMAKLPGAEARGVDRPVGDYLAAATAQISGINGPAAGNASQTRSSPYGGNRQARRHPDR